MHLSASGLANNAVAPPGPHLVAPPQFNIVPWHCLVVTAEYRSQLDDLDAHDLAATWAVVQVGGRPVGLRACKWWCSSRAVGWFA